MKILIFDTETTGLSPFDNVILQLSYQIVDSADWSVTKNVNHYFDWPVEEWRVSKRAIEVNGLTKEFLATQQLSNKKEALEEFVADKDSVELLVAHNLDFDKKFIVAECKEYQVKYANSGWNSVYDTMKKTTNLCCIEKYYGRGYKYPKLIELAQYLCVETNDLNLHDSSADVELTKRCFVELVNRGYYNLEKTDTGISVQLHVESPEDFTFTYFTDDGLEISEEYLVLRYGKKAIKENKENVIQLWAEQNEEERNELKKIHCNLPGIADLLDFEKELKSLAPSKYKKQAFAEEIPNKEALEAKLIKDAQEKISSILFWTNSSKRRAYVDEHLDVEFAQLMAIYEEKKAAFEKSELEKEAKYNNEAQKKYQARKEHLQALIAGNKDAIECAISHGGIFNYPLTIDVSPTMDSENFLTLNVTLPDITDIPQLFGDRLASGKYKIKNISEKTKREDYVLDITGLGFYLAACYANCAPSISTIKVVGWIRNNESESGKQALYYFEITREQLKSLKGLEFVPYEQIQQYPHAMNMSKTFLLKEIVIK